VRTLDDDDPGRPPRPRPARPQRRSFTAEQKAEFVRGYEACPDGKKGAYLREHGLYSSHITKWRAQPGKDAARAQQKRADEIEALRDKVAALEGDLAASQRTVVTLGKAFELLDQISKSSDKETKSGRC